MLMLRTDKQLRQSGIQGFANLFEELNRLFATSILDGAPIANLTEKPSAEGNGTEPR